MGLKLKHMILEITLCSVDDESLGQSKAKCVCSFPQELNDVVRAKFIEESPETLIETNPSFFSPFALVIATQDELERQLQEAISNTSSQDDTSSTSESTVDQRRIMDGLLKSHPGRLIGEGSGFTRSDLEGRKKGRMSTADLNVATEAKIQAAMEEFHRRDAIRDEEFKRRDEEFKRWEEEFKRRDAIREEELKRRLDEVDRLRGQMNFFQSPQTFEGMIATYLKNCGVFGQAGRGNGRNDDQQGSSGT